MQLIIYLLISKENLVFSADKAMHLGDCIDKMDHIQLGDGGSSLFDEMNRKLHSFSFLMIIYKLDRLGIVILESRRYPGNC